MRERECVCVGVWVCVCGEEVWVGMLMDGEVKSDNQTLPHKLHLTA